MPRIPRSIGHPWTTILLLLLLLLGRTIGIPRPEKTDV
jgi:hypothetical protein